MENFEKIVLVSDSLEYKSEELDVYNRDIDRPHKDYVSQLLDSLKEYYPDSILYHSPSELLDNIHKHKKDIIFPFWFGKNSRNRHSLIPAICEAAGICYLGGDAYTKIVCNDKSLSKLLCKDAGLDTPNSITIYSEQDINFISQLKFPCVVKPLFEGTSLGISEKNLVDNIAFAIELAKELLKEFNQPILIEEFITGKEVSICFIGRYDKVIAWEAAERYLTGDDNYFINRLYTFEEKKSETMPLELRSVKNDISKEIFESCKKLFGYLDKVEFMRIDGRLSEKSFTVIELTPETHLGHDAEFCGTFICGGQYTYTQVIKLLIDNCLVRYQNQNANK